MADGKETEGKSHKEIRREYTFNKLKGLGQEIIEEIEKNKVPSLKVPSRGTGNIVYDDAKRYYVLGDRYGKRSLGNVKQIRKLQKHLRAKKAAKEKEKRSKVFEDFVPVIIEEAAKLGETGVPEYQEVLAKVTKRALAELLGEKVEEDVEEEELDAIIMEEVDEFGHSVSEDESTLNKSNEEDEIGDLDE